MDVSQWIFFSIVIRNANKWRGQLTKSFFHCNCNYVRFRIGNSTNCNGYGFRIILLIAIEIPIFALLRVYCIIIIIILWWVRDTWSWVRLILGPFTFWWIISNFVISSFIFPWFMVSYFSQLRINPFELKGNITKIIRLFFMEENNLN